MSNQETALPDDLLANESLAGFKTVEGLVTGINDLKTKAATPAGFDSLDDDVKNDPNISKYKGNFVNMAKGHIELAKLVGRKGVIVPAENATDEERSTFYNSLGRPETADAYKLAPLENAHKELITTPETEKEYKELAHKIGLTQAQAEALNTWQATRLNQALINRDKAETEAMNEAVKALRQEWAGQFDANTALANKVVLKFGGQGAIDAFGDLGNNPAVMKFLANIGKKISEDALNRGEHSDLAMTTQIAQSKLKDINAKIMATEQTDPSYPDLIKEKNNLYQLAYPEGGQQ